MGDEITEETRIGLLAAGPTIQTATLTLTNTQINTLSSSSQILIAAPGANNIIIPMTISASLKYGSTFNFSNPSQSTYQKGIRIRLGPSSQQNLLWKTGIIDTPQTADRFASGFVGSVGNYNTTSSYMNQPLRVYSDCAYKDGANSSITFTCVYYIHTIV